MSFRLEGFVFELQYSLANLQTASIGKRVFHVGNTFRSFRQGFNFVVFLKVVVQGQYHEETQDDNDYLPKNCFFFHSYSNIDEKTG